MDRFLRGRRASVAKRRRRPPPREGQEAVTVVAVETSTQRVALVGGLGTCRANNSGDGVICWVIDEAAEIQRALTVPVTGERRMWLVVRHVEGTQANADARWVECRSHSTTLPRQRSARVRNQQRNLRLDAVVVRLRRGLTPAPPDASENGPTKRYEKVGVAKCRATLCCRTLGGHANRLDALVSASEGRRRW